MFEALKPPLIAETGDCLRARVSHLPRQDSCFAAVQCLLEENAEEVLKDVDSHLSMAARNGRLRRTALALSWVTLAVVCMLASACNSDSKKTESRDAGSKQPPSTERDAGRTATPKDAGMEPTPIGKSDASKSDPPPKLAPCDLVTPSVCPSGGCPAGTACVPNLCGGTECVEGRACASDADCSTGACDEGSGRCEPEVECTVSRDCPLGFECEDALCVDRRIECWSTKRQACPLGYICFSPQLARAFCTRVFEPCERRSQCGPSSVCEDKTLDGHGECVANGPCPATCPADTGCGFLPSLGGREADCYLYHVCHVDADCSAQAPKCLHGASDGPGQCAPAQGHCNSNSDCPPTSVCGMKVLGAAPRCIGGSSEP